MSDRADGADPVLRDAWRSATARLAVSAGSLTALVSLFHHVPVSVASLRGAVAYLAVRVVAHAGFLALRLAVAAERRASAGDEES